MGVLTRSKKQETRQSAFLKVMHPRGYVELFREPITAAEIMRRYPKHCIAEPDFFEYPWIVVHPESILVPGKVFLLVPHSTVDKVLKKKRHELQSMNLKEDHYHHHPHHHHHRIETTHHPRRHKRRETNHHPHHHQGREINHHPPHHHRSETNHHPHHQGRETNHHPHHHHHHRGRETNQHHRSSKESCSNGRQEQDSDNGSLYKSSFFESWKKMQKQLQQPHEESSFHLDFELDSSLHSNRPRVASPEQVELQRVKSCLRKADSDRKKLKLKVSFASPVVVLDSRRGSPSVELFSRI